MLTHLRPAAVLLGLFTVLTGLAYPLVMTGIVQVAMPAAAKGSLLYRDKVVAGSALIGQAFTSDRYFHGRPSATSAPDPKDDSKTVDAPYNGANSAGSNLGPIAKKLLERVEADVAELKKEGAEKIPADAVTTSGSGLDPHISPAFAELQVRRVAAARQVPEARVRAVLDGIRERPLLGILGAHRVNVLRLNMALDAALVSGSR